VAGITLGGFWLLTPSREELKALRAERAQLQGAIDELAQRGGRADFKTCGVGNAHLCVRVEPRLGRFGDDKDYFVITIGRGIEFLTDTPLPRRLSLSRKATRSWGRETEVEHVRDSG
jgi:hypothetical protein